jgi:hypothetical protein
MPVGHAKLIGNTDEDPGRSITFTGGTHSGASKTKVVAKAGLLSPNSARAASVSPRCQARFRRKTVVSAEKDIPGAAFEQTMGRPSNSSAFYITEQFDAIASKVNSAIIVGRKPAEA